MKRIVPVLLILSILVCWLPQGANASEISDVEEVLTAVAANAPADSVVGSIMIGLGVLVGVSNTDWDTVVSDAVTYLIDQGAINSDGTVDIWSLSNAGYQYGVSESLIDLVRSWLFAEEVISDIEIPDGYFMANGRMLPSMSGYDTTYCNYRIIYETPEGDVWWISSKYAFTPTYHSASGGYALTASVGYYWMYSMSADGTKWNRVSYGGTPGIYYYTGYGHTMLYSSAEILHSDGRIFVPKMTGMTANYASVVDGVAAGEIATSDKALADGYTTWADNIVSVTDSDGTISVWPVGLGSTYEDTRSLSQDSVWAGISSYSSITSIDVSRTPDSVTPGMPLGIAIDVTGTGDFDPSCTCTVSGNTSSSTYVWLADEYETPNIYTLECGSDETATELIVTVTSVQDPMVSASKTITVNVGSGGSDPTESTETTDPSDPTEPSSGDDSSDDSVVDGLVDYFDGLQAEAESQGQSSVDEVIEIIPDESEDFISSLSTLISVLQYEGTDAVLTLPAVVVPSVGGLFPEFTLLEETKIDFEEYIALMPGELLTLVRALFDAAIVAYCVKEFLDLVGGLGSGFKNMYNQGAD